MEALAAFALASNVLQFVEVGLKIVSKAKGYKRSNDGALKEDKELESVVVDLDARLCHLQPVNNEGLKDIVEECRGIGTELQDALRKAQSSKGRGLWSSYRKALNTVWHERAILDKETRLKRLRGQVHFHLQTILSTDVAELLRLSVTTDQNVTELKAIVEANCNNIIAGIPSNLANEADWLKLRDSFMDFVHASNEGKSGGTLSAGRPNEDEFLQSLEFRSIDDREESIPISHARTYQWLLLDYESHKTHKTEGQPSLSYQEERRRSKVELLEICRKVGVDTVRAEDAMSLRSVDVCPSQHLQEWMEKGKGVFWIWGKPGCGKSTMMKSMLQNRSMNKRLSQLLSAWSGDQRPLMASFFFFRPGMSLQRSHTGLLRSLLFQVLKQRPSLIDEIFTDKEQRDGMARSKDPNISEDDVWSIGELRRAFRRWRHADTSSLYLHVDGIDEIDSTYQDITNILTDIADFDGIKILVAGRWTPEFHEAFPLTLALHETTALDILQFTVDNLNRPQLTECLDNPSIQFLSILTEIINAAQGVFQWVKIVLESLIHGMRRYESYEQLYGRLKEYPKDLDRLYWFLYQSVDARHLADAAFWLLTIQECQAGAISRKDSRPHEYQTGEIGGSKSDYGISLQGIWRMTATKMCYAEMYHADDAGALKRMYQEFTWNSRSFHRLLLWNRRMRSLATTERMRSQCPHFFDVGPSKGGSRISFAHRTVLDFLAKPDIAKSLRAILPSNRNPLLAIIASEVITRLNLNQKNPTASRKHVGYPLRELAHLTKNLRYADSRRFWIQMKPIFENFKTYFATDEKALLATHGWYITEDSNQGLENCQYDETQFFEKVFTRTEPALHILAWVGLPISNIASCLQDSSLSPQDRELLILGLLYARHETWFYKSFAEIGINQSFFSQAFPSGLPNRSVGLRLIFERLNSYCERPLVIKMLVYKEHTCAMSLLQLSQLFIENGADPNLLYDSACSHLAVRSSPLSILQTMKGCLPSLYLDAPEEECRARCEASPDGSDGWYLQRLADCQIQLDETIAFFRLKGAIEDGNGRIAL